jgi:hypothetical protein
MQEIFAAWLNTLAAANGGPSGRGDCAARPAYWRHTGRPGDKAQQLRQVGRGRGQDHDDD